MKVRPIFAVPWVRGAWALVAALCFVLMSDWPLPSTSPEGRKHDPSNQSRQVQRSKPFRASATGLLASRARALVHDYESKGLFRGAILVARGDEVVTIELGLKHQERSEPSQSGTLFRLGSISKQFIGAAILALEEDGIFHVDDPVERYLPEYPKHAFQRDGQSVTIHHLLRHTSGLPDYENVLSVALPQRLAPLPRPVLIKLLKEHPLRTVPGERFAYNNANYDLLGQLIERVTRTSAENYVRMRLIARTAAQRIGAIPTSDEATLLAHGHYPIGPFLLDVETAFGVSSNAFAVEAVSGNFFASAPDLYLWFRDLLGGRVLSPASLDRMLTPGEGGYGYGISIDNVSGWTRVRHTGAVAGFASLVELYPKKNAAIIALSNGDIASTPMNELASGLRVLITEPNEPRNLVHGAPRDASSSTGSFTRRMIASLRGALFVLFSRTTHGSLLQAGLIFVLVLSLSRSYRDYRAVVVSGVSSISMLMIILSLGGAELRLVGTLALLSGVPLGFGWPQSGMPAQGASPQRAQAWFEFAASLVVCALALRFLAMLAGVALACATMGGLFGNALARVISRRRTVFCPNTTNRGTP